MKRWFLFPLFLFTCSLLLAQGIQGEWWKVLNGNIRYAVKAEKETLKGIQGKLDSLHRCGFRIIEIFAPSEGTELYHNLAVKDFYKIDPAIGSANDLRELVAACHARGMAIMAFINEGYCSLEAPMFLKACEDVKNGVSGRERDWFLWSDTDTCRLSGANKFFKQEGKWIFSEQAGKFYFSKWKGQPQFNYGSREWQEECRKITRFYLDFGFDGLVLDAPNFYVNCTWEIIRHCITDVVNEVPGRYSQPEGAGAFGDDPLEWIKQGKFTCVQDYGLGIWWDHVPMVAASVESGSPCVLDTRLTEYHDKVNAAGAISYFYPFWDRPLWAARRLIEIAFLASSGHQFTLAGGTGGYTGSEVTEKWSVADRNKCFSILQQVNSNPALGPFGERIKLDTQDNSRYYAYVRYTSDNKHKVLVVLNFNGPQNICIQMNSKILRGAREIRNLGNSSDRIPIKNKQVVVPLPWLGWGFYEVL